MVLLKNYDQTHVILIIIIETEIQILQLILAQKLQ